MLSKIFLETTVAHVFYYNIDTVGSHRDPVKINYIRVIR